MRFQIRKKYLFMLVAVLVWSAFLTKTAYALLMDSVTLSGNTVTVGAVSMALSNSQAATSTTYDKSREGFAFSMVPGQSMDKFFLLKNTSTADLSIQPDFAPIVPTTTSHTLESVTMLEIVPVDANGETIAGATGASGFIGNLVGKRTVITGGAIPKGGYQRYRMRIRIDPTYSIPGDVLAFDLQITGVQQG